MQNVVTADLEKSLEESSHTNLKPFFAQWISWRGRAQVRDYSRATILNAKQVRLAMRQTQEVRGHVGLFDVPVTVEITTAAGARSFPIEVSSADQTVYCFGWIPRRLMVLFDKGDKILKTVEFQWASPGGVDLPASECEGCAGPRQRRAGARCGEGK